MKSIQELTLAQKVGQLLMFAFWGTEPNEQTRILLEECHVGGLIYFQRNVQDVAQVFRLNKTLQEQSKIPLFIGIDHEGGMVRRIQRGITALPGAMTFSATKNSRAVYQLNLQVAKELKMLGFTHNFAPVGDINTNPYNPVIHTRAYSDKKEVVARYSKAVILAHQKAGLYCSMKHFLGHGDTNTDSHLGIAKVSKSKKDLLKVEAHPFRSAIRQNISSIMMSHVIYNKIDAKYPASLSAAVVEETLKDILGFRGLVITDSLTMGAIWKRFSIEEILIHSLNAGVDMLIFCGKADIEEQRHIYQTLLSLVESGKISKKRIDQALEKIWKQKQSFQYINNNEWVQVKDKFMPSKTLLLSQKIYENSITCVKGSLKKKHITKENAILLFPKQFIQTELDNKEDYLQNELRVQSPFCVHYYDETTIELTIRTTDTYEYVILCTNNVKSGDFQTDVFDKLDKNKTIVVAIRSPYDILYLQGVSTYITTYELGIENIKVLMEVLTKNKKMKGKLPIHLERGKK